MADLDDFFAKRDKGKKKKKFTTVDDATKVLETKAKERLKAATGKSTYMPSGEGDPQPALSEYRQQQDDDDEWLEVKDFEPDFTGLKIQELVLEDSEDELDKEAEGKDDGDTEGGPWNKVISKGREKEVEVKPSESTEEPKEEVSEAKKEEAPAPAEEPKTTGGYVPPARRQQMEGKTEPQPAGGSSSASSNAYVPPSRRAGATTTAKPKKGGIPILTNEESFPSLGS